MPVYFKPLRRKIGVTTLGLACVFLVGWVRSFTSTDTLEWNFKAFGCGVVSLDSVVTVAGGRLAGQFAWTLPEFTSGDFSTLESQSKEVDWRWRFVGIRFGMSPKNEPLTSLFFVVFAYLWIVVPLTLLSAWLLLSRPNGLRVGNKSLHPLPLERDR